MTDNEAAELLFFDTFSHEVDTDINLDLVQFPKPVFITQIRIIPLGARVQADFPGGVRLGATNPSKFAIEFFVNDLGMPGASTFENLGHLQYNQNDCIHLECAQDKIPTDGLVLRGWYSTITLAVYGILPKTLSNELNIASPPPPICEPEEMCNISADARNTAVLQEDNIKDEWKEPLSVAASELHKPVAAVSDYERDDMDYEMSSREREREREHQYHSTEDERNRRNRKTSYSSVDRSPSSRNRTVSDSNEREYLRGARDKRDWSRSPDYTRHSRRKRSERSRSDAEDTHKWPRTPPASIDSPTRPRSPDNMDYNTNDDESQHYKMKSQPYMRSNDSLATSNTAVTQEAVSMGGAGDDDDDGTPGTPGEQFEPILSDDEIIGDDDDDLATPEGDNDSMAGADQATADEFEMELQTAASAAKPAILEFDPFSMPICRYESDLSAHYQKELENLHLLFKKFSLQVRCDNVAGFREPSLGSEDRENFVYLGELLIGQLAYLAQQLRRRNFVLREFFGGSNDDHLRQAYGILQISLDFEAACLQTQPAFKIRHIKVGARLAELLGGCEDFISYLHQRQYDPFMALMKLYQQDYMALSIKLMLLKAIYSLLDTKTGVHMFINGKLNGYQLLLEMLQQTHLTRTKYALQAIIKKMHLNEALESVRDNCQTSFCADEMNVGDLLEPIEQALEQLMDALSQNALNYQQPRRYLPVSKKFEIVPDVVAQRSFGLSLQSYFQQHTLCESLVLLFSNASELPHSLLLRCVEVMEALLGLNIGLDYLMDDCFESTKVLLAILLGLEEVPEEIKETFLEGSSTKVEVKAEITNDNVKETLKEDSTQAVPDYAVASTKEEPQTPTPVETESIKQESASDDSNTIAVPSKPAVLQRLQQLGLELAFKMQTRYHLDAIAYTAASATYDAGKLADHLHALYSQTCTSPGRQYTVEVIGLNNNLAIFVDLIKKEQRLQAKRQLSSPGAKYKSPVLSYAMDMVDCCVRYCESLEYLIEHGPLLLELAKNHETFEPSVSAVLQEMFVYLKPLESVNIFAYDDITPLVEVITRSLEYITTFPGDLIMGLRILRHLAIGSSRTPATQCADTEQLKHRFVALQFYAADGVQTLTQILEKLCAFFEQPGLHTPALMTIQGLHCCQIVLPALQVLREMLSFAIQCRDVQFKDLTAIDHLMRTYALMHYFPAGSQAAMEVPLAKKEIIQTLLAYTQPNEQDEESLHKSLWTQMVREILKNIQGPSTFLPGLQILSELLPLPLPMPLPSNVQLMESQKQRLITERKLWSAHLHPQSAQLSKLIECIAPTTCQPLSDLLSRVCLQLADLAPNMTLLISKTLSDFLCAEWTNAGGQPNQTLARLLEFFARLTAYPSLKSSALSILSGKLWDLFAAVLACTGDAPLRCQVFVHRILESFLDSEISLISPHSTAMPELNLASALPPKELIPRIVESVWMNLHQTEVTHEVSALGVRNLAILTEHDITLYHLSTHLKQKSSEFQQWLRKVIHHNETHTYSSNIKSLILLLRSLTHIDESTIVDPTLPRRTLKLSPLELKGIIGLDQSTPDEPNVMQRMRSILADQESPDEALLNDLNVLIGQLESLDSTAVMDIDEESACVWTEPILPQTESIVTQYSARPIFTLYDDNQDKAERQLTPGFWLDPHAIEKYISNGSDDFEAQYERIPCDLYDLANTCLPMDTTNLTIDCKRLLHLSASPQSNRERTPTGAPCFRTRRVEVEPSTGRPEKKLYITPVRGRGFARAPPSRGDLFRSRPPNTSRPPSLHVDDFLALETCGAQPTGPTGYNKIPPIMRGNRVGRNRGSRISAAAAYRKSKGMRTSSPSPWNDGSSPHYRSGMGDPHYGSSPHFSSRPPRSRGSHMRSYLR